ncbi:FAD-dependent oxidoreductase [Lichenicola cladoniae]|uniref:FAD-dependent oxidoreductase n=1 Tax=Lichenicola cladoniae TaxID=1484109 RepID=A0A6M8HLD6_9PROT|nr:FAD-dependent oxidoreductase [Lichenicola cladoniae]NPD68902.1 FAD-dependent oxidoreductase [Acetobacteraceae bacterium]QKE89150.1 FAD-dependent oxidoreductase [Lichenicola cladoniae]
MRIAVIGAGIAGLACADELRRHDHPVTVFDKGRGPGGRMSTRRLDTPSGQAGFDHGAQYFTARDPAFLAQVEQWETLGLVASWPAAGPDAWTGAPSMNAPARHLAASLDVRLGARIETMSRRRQERGGAAAWHLQVEQQSAQGPFDAVVVAIPSEQAATLLAAWDDDFAALARATPSRPCWTVVAAFAERLPVATDLLQHLRPIQWAARNSAKPGRSPPESWVIQADPDWSDAHLEEAPETILADLLAAFSTVAGIRLPPPLVARAHRWRYARSGSAGVAMLWNDALRLGVCGDWLLGARVECAWLSGTRLAAAILDGAGRPTNMAEPT